MGQRLNNMYRRRSLRLHQIIIDTVSRSAGSTTSDRGLSNPMDSYQRSVDQIFRFLCEDNKGAAREIL